MKETSFRSTASFGKRQEYVAVAELLKRGYDVYMTLVDDQQIDCIIRLPTSPPQYIDLQIKARSTAAKNASTFSAMEIREPRENFYFLFYSEACDTYWVMPSLELIEKANQNKSGKNAGKYSIVFANENAAGKWVPRPKWKQYENAFNLLSLACEKSEAELA
ncbi:hypothetical protein [Pseudovibrio sp. Ad37]|uniref:hypothetical protein n=1 Tax=Pseudovibrio sp. Ad37 TaxID=989422 RepID=UPI0007AE5B2B|nr:hypothetical protein [Pseudovibrio sp. Ad37]KZL21967.1 hypothetical protein PsAD37_03487 [Pseudovibrio sp. Ad37]